MAEVRDRVRLVEAAMIAGPEIAATIQRAEIEAVLGAEEGEPELFIDVRRGNGVASEHTLRLDWEKDELEKLLRATEGETVKLTFSGSELERALAEADVEAHGIRERVLVLAVAAATATAGASQASAGTPSLVVRDAGGGSAASIEMVSDAASSGRASEAATSPQLISDAAASGPVAAEAATSPQLISDAAASGPVAAEAATSPQLISDAALSGPGATAGTEAATAGSSDSTAFSPDPATTGAIAGGVALLITAAGFGVRKRHRHQVRPT
jgi:hypothetical protein